MGHTVLAAALSRSPHSNSALRVLERRAGFQLYDLVATIMEKDVCKLEHILHHSFALSTALAGSADGGPWCLYYCIFFFAIVEVSSVPLCAVDLYRQLPILLKLPLHSAINEVCRVVFALSFLVVRCLFFPCLMAFRLWPDMASAYIAGDVRVSMPVFVWMMFASIFLTGLQLFWGYKIVKVVAKGNLKGRDKCAVQNETD